jgi:hypothetical protein
MVRTSGHAYPWDVLGDPDFVGRVRDIGVDAVTLAGVYHSARAATPLHPAHQLVEAPNTALYRSLRAEVWHGRRLTPLAAPSWVDDPDSFGTAAAILDRAGIPVNAWLVLAHDSRIGTLAPDLAVVNCFGDRYRYALCPQHAEVRDYLALLAAETVRDVPLAGFSIEACGQLGLTHQCVHEKTDDAWTPAANRLLSICCCQACRAAWTDAGFDADRLVGALRDAVRNNDEPLAGLDVVLAARHAATDALRAQVLAALREVNPTAEVTLHAHPDPWATGASPGLTATAAGDVDVLLVPCWPTTPASVEVVAAAARTGRNDRSGPPGGAARPGPVAVDAYVTVLPPADATQLADYARRLLAAGATRLSLYHLGLAPKWRQRYLAELVEVATAAVTPASG